jgi:peptide/nickel transport system permease protein
MVGYIIRRCLLGIVVLLLVTIIVFLLLQLVPGDIAALVLGINATPEQLQAERHALWLDRPLVEQYGHWFNGAIRGQFGDSVIYHRPVADLLKTRVPITLHLAIESLFISTFLGIVAGVVCAIRRGGFLDTTITLAANTGIAIPIFWLGILGIYLFGLKLGWIPIQGYVSPFEDLGKSFQHTILPVLCMAISPIAFLARQTRSSMLEVISQDYIRTAWSKGLREFTVVSRHTLKNSLIPVLTFFGIGLSNIVGGSVLIETVFNIPGMGRLIVQAAQSKDMFVVQACTLVIALMVVLMNTVVDISYGLVDPRIRYN